MYRPKKEFNIKNIMNSEEYEINKQQLQDELNNNNIKFNSGTYRSTESNVKTSTQKEKMSYRDRIQLNSMKRTYKESKDLKDIVINNIKRNLPRNYNFKLTIKDNNYGKNQISSIMH